MHKNNKIESARFNLALSYTVKDVNLTIYYYIEYKHIILKRRMHMTRDIILEELMALRFQFSDLKSLMSLTTELSKRFQERKRKEIMEIAEEIMNLADNETSNFQEKKVKFLSWIVLVSRLRLCN